MLGQCLLVGVESEGMGRFRFGSFVQGAEEFEDEEQRPMESQHRSTEIQRIGLDQLLSLLVGDALLNRDEMLRISPVQVALQNGHFVHHVVLDEAEDPTQLIDESNRERRREKGREERETST